MDAIDPFTDRRPVHCVTVCILHILVTHDLVNKNNVDCADHRSADDRGSCSYLENRVVVQ